MKNVVLIRSNPVNPDPPVEKVAYSLSQNGYNVTILGWDRDENYYSKTVNTTQMGDNIRIVRFGIKAEYGGGIKKTSIQMLKFQSRLKNWLLENQDSFDIIHAFDFDTGLIATNIAKKYKKKLIYHILDYYVDSHGLRGTIYEKPVKHLENKIINQADATVICTEKRRKQIAGSSPNHLYVIHNTPRLIPFDEEYDLQGNKRDSQIAKIVYVGILTGSRMLKEIIELVSADQRLELHIGGFGPRASEIKSKTKYINNIFFYGKVPYAETLAIENKSDIMVAIYDPNVPNHKYSAPNKFYESIMLGKPIIMSKNTGFDDIILKYGLGECIEYSTEGLKQGINSLLENRHLWSEMGQRGKSLYKESYSWDVMEQRLLEMYRNI